MRVLPIYGVGEIQRFIPKTNIVQLLRDLKLLDCTELSKSTKMTQRILLIVFLLSPIITMAQLSVSGEIRPRTEYLRGFKTLATSNDQNPAFFTSQRSRLNFQLVNDKTKVYVCLQDVRIWGNQPQLIITDGASTTLHEAWAQTKLDSFISLKIGRQEIIYDDHRIFGNVGWAQQARSHDAAVFSYKRNKFRADLGLAFNQAILNLFGTNYADIKNYKDMQYLWVNRKWKDVSGSVLILNNGFQFNDSIGVYHTNYLQTVGTRWTYKNKELAANAAVYYQIGTGTDSSESSINAFYVAADLAYDVTEKINFKIGTEMLSGNDIGGIQNENKAFNPFFGTNHKFNGFMDYFYVGNHANNVGLNDVFVRATYKFKKATAFIDGHYFLASGDMGNDVQGLGTEVDLVVAAKINAQTGIKLGYSQMFATESMKVLKGGDNGATNNWAWLMLTFNPSFHLRK